MLYVHSSNRYETLARRLLDQLGGTRDDVFASDQVVVPSAAMQRHLTLAMADAHGICANVEFVYLARWLWRQVARVVQGVAAESPFDPAALAWRVYAAFGDAAFVDAHPRLGGYLATAGADHVMRYELAVKTAALLEQYVTYRPDWLAKWQGASAPHPGPHPGREREQNPRQRDGLSSLPPGPGAGRGGDTAAADEAWQAALWRRIARELELQADNPLALLVRELERGGATRAREAGLPPAVHVFGLSAMPPLHLQALQALGRSMDVHVYALNPCREYWFDLVDLKQLSQLDAAGQAQAFDVGHRLLASWGKQTQSSLALLTGIGEGEGAQGAEEYQRAGSASLLARLQDSILDLQELEPASIDLAGGDRSIEVHVCHSLTRELEVLHDHLLGLFAADDSLEPSDILVVTPDLPGAAPLIEAVFGTMPPQRRIAYAITGLGRSTVNAPVRALLQLLALAASRCTATAVFGLLQQPVVARRFGFDDEGLLQVHDWIRESGIHWGLDQDHVAGLDLPAQAAHTLADGLERLYLGYALPGHVQEPFGGLQPSGGAEGSSAVALGAFWRFVQALQDLRGAMARARTGGDWVSWLHAAADQFISGAHGEIEDLLELHATLDQLGDAMLRGGLDEPVPSSVIRAALESAFEDPARGGVPTGRVTFAGMASLRNVPFKVICAIGLNDRAFPTADRPPEFDLMARAPRLGDRQRRTDQRTLFLDLVLAARRSLYLSYAGRSIHDNAPLPPSVLIAELLDVLVPAIAASGDSEAALKAAREHLVVAHPLQPFSPDAFSAADERVRSFDADLAQALREALTATPDAGGRAPRAGPGPGSGPPGEAGGEADEEEAAAPDAACFFTEPLAEPGPEWRTVPIARLVEFFRNPSQYLLRRRLNLDLGWDEAPLDDDEPFLPDVPSRSQLAQRLLPLLLEGTDLATARRLAQAGTELPGGVIGRAEMERELARLGRFAQAVRRASAGDVLPPHQASIELAVAGEPWAIQGAFADLRPAGAVRWRYDDERPNDVLAAWVHHLALCAQPHPDGEPVTRSVTRLGTRTYSALGAAEAREHLARLVALYRAGLARPLHFFPKSAWALLQEGERAARQKWTGGNSEFGGERDHAAYRLALRGVAEPLDGEFRESAATVFGHIPGDWLPHVSCGEQA
ncbi:exodeoxyribonuclease V subunit gamma [Ramlibacter sp. RBP-2]|uniref:RecBCD enzyme subunit RecC n=1 Tax=Ramlibacter lithotrophicus TaxID=2606681 RepID=A0A7X6DCX4_9BURK|nr:exodeoxyribonuclease V subunit gamma [Ramlibacter lithotrophicus]NKE64845.1 exodeoxyribonuclease V subunit gamma [Ramlibacter lithotrophicus]